MVVSRLTEVEVPSAIARRLREGRVSEPDRDAVVKAFLDDMHRWEVIELSSDVARRALALLSSHSIRAGDAIQLASALLARDRAGSILSQFVASDVRLPAAARLEGLPIHED